ncbi:MAG TPA: prephenate dehydrogenase/arogenate dehydrogenase family protein [Terrimicrobiaceae bacterium]|nr:prephenate dehydrogenase/arogenate dehydrogenase family protein [Terrimicrobiaceae bacterium]
MRKVRPEWNLRLWTRCLETARKALAVFPSVSTDEAETAEGADLCVLCTPIGTMQSLAERIVSQLPPAATVTDVGSVKGGVVQGLERILGARFVGSHPMAGSEQSGFDAARANLFEGAVCIVTPTPSSLPGSLRTVRDLWEGVGCRLVMMPPNEHDECIARVSHLPHAVAAALVNAINLRVADAGAVAGGGYRDTTRIAASPPAMWREILIENRAELAAGLGDFSTMLEKMKEMILSGDAAALETFLERAKTLRENLP